MRELDLLRAPDAPRPTGASGERVSSPASAADAPTALAEAREHDPSLRAGLFSDLFAEPGRVRAALEATADEVLLQDGLPTYEAAFLAAFGSRWSRQVIRSVAADACRNWIWGGWEWRAYLARVAAQKEKLTPRLAGWETTRVPVLRHRGRGAVLVTFHAAMFRFLITDLALLGCNVTMAVDADAMQRLASGWTGVDTSAFARLHAVSAEGPRAVEFLGEALAREELVLLCVDGNAGPRGRHGAGGSFRVRLLGHEVAAKTGAARLSAAYGRPLVVLFADRDTPLTGRVREALVAQPDPSWDAERQRSYTTDVMRAAWAVYESAVLRAPRDWEGARLYNLWRTDRSPSLGTDDAERVVAAFDAGRGVHAASRRVVGWPARDRYCWMDVESLQVVALPAWAIPLARQLEASGLSRVAILQGAFTGGERARAMDLVRTLAGRGLLEVAEGE